MLRGEFGSGSSGIHMELANIIKLIAAYHRLNIVAVSLCINDNSTVSTHKRSPRTDGITILRDEDTTRRGLQLSF